MSDVLKTGEPLRPAKAQASGADAPQKCLRSLPEAVNPAVSAFKKWLYEAEALTCAANQVFNLPDDLSRQGVQNRKDAGTFPNSCGEESCGTKGTLAFATGGILCSVAGGEIWARLKSSWNRISQFYPTAEPAGGLKMSPRFGDISARDPGQEHRYFLWVP